MSLHHPDHGATESHSLIKFSGQPRMKQKPPGASTLLLTIVIKRMSLLFGFGKHNEVNVIESSYDD